MGRWQQQDATVCIFGTVNCAFGENTSDARRLVTEHNADCDAYEARIAELEADREILATEAERWEIKAKSDHHRLCSEVDSTEKKYDSSCAELARVRAESLRVVKCGESFGIDEVERWREVFDAIYIMDDNLYECADGETVWPILFQRWEDEG